MLKDVSTEHEMSGLTMRTGGPTSIQVARDPKTAQRPWIFWPRIFVTRRFPSWVLQTNVSASDSSSTPIRLCTDSKPFLWPCWHRIFLLTNCWYQIIYQLPQGVPIVCTGCTHATAVYFLDTGTYRAPRFRIWSWAQQHSMARLKDVKAWSARLQLWYFGSGGTAHRLGPWDNRDWYILQDTHWIILKYHEILIDFLGFD